MGGLRVVTVKEGKTKKGSKKNRRKTNTGTDRVSESENSGGETQNEEWTGGSVRQKKWHTFRDAPVVVGFFVIC